MSNQSENKIAQLSLPKDDKFLKSTNTPLVALAVILALGVGSYYYYDQTLQEAPSSTASSSLSVSDSTGETGLSSSVEKPSSNPQNTLSVRADSSTSAADTNGHKGKVLDASGHIIARRVATISSQVTSIVKHLLIEEGQVVGNNDVLAKLDNSQAKFSLAIAKASLRADEAQLVELYNQLQRAEIKLKRIENLFAKNALSQEELDTERLQVKQLNTQIENRKALNEMAAQQVKLASYNLEQHTIRAPFAGMVVQKNAQVGELISAGMSGGGSIRTGIATIVDMSSLEIEVDVAESYINRIFPGQPAVAHLDAYPDWDIKSEVLTIIPTANRQKATVKVRVKLIDMDERILPDMAVSVSFMKDKLSAMKK